MAINNYGFPMQYPMAYQQPYPIQQTVTNSPVNMNYMNQPRGNGIIWVQGEAGAKAYPVAPGNSVLLMDSESDCFYIKTTDASGVPSPLRCFAYSEVNRTVYSKESEPVHEDAKYVTRDEFEELKRIVNDRTYQRKDNRNGEQAFSRNSKQQSNE